jgi:hypothetical protein
VCCSYPKPSDSARWPSATTALQTLQCMYMYECFTLGRISQVCLDIVNQLKKRKQSVRMGNKNSTQYENPAHSFTPVCVCTVCTYYNMLMDLNFNNSIYTTISITTKPRITFRAIHIGRSAEPLVAGVAERLPGPSRPRLHELPDISVAFNTNPSLLPLLQLSTTTL